MEINQPTAFRIETPAFQVEMSIDAKLSGHGKKHLANVIDYGRH